ncbi:hypothetical protein B296_00034778 [Ensete ventricosum]|uniref:WAT1-related protein n=1 Tax=Ensete ventricosum TaxID=4639 RepID=A0A426ZBA7_ENSVE|nr:hypothetical protein B296_00034778 [Ensete ventricosum]
MADVDARKVCGVPERTQLHVAMLALQFGYAGFHVVSRAALNMGISKVVFPVYRNIIALILLVPFAFFLEKKDRPAMTLSFAVQFFLLALCGITANQGFYLLGLEYTSPTFASAIQNSVPAITFLMAAVLRQDPMNRIEKVRIDRRDGIAKLMGTLACAPVLKKYPARLSVTSYTCFFGVIQFLVIAAFIERDSEAWMFHSGGEFFTILYAGFVASGIAFAVQIWCIDRGGPVFVAVYQPVQTLVVAIMAAIALGEEFYLGGIIGAIFIVAGLYLVLWGKSEERGFAAMEAAISASSNPELDAVRAAASFKASSLKQPLLPSTTSESV